MHCTKEPREGISDSIFEPVSRTSNPLVPASVRKQHAILCHLASLFGEKLGVLRPVGQDHIRSQANKNRRNALEEEDHCQAWRLAMLSMFSRMPAARKPDRMCATVSPACQMAMRIGDSFMLYQPEVTGHCALESRVLSRMEASSLRVRPGKNGASASPMKKRATQNPAPLFSVSFIL